MRDCGKVFREVERLCLDGPLAQVAAALPDRLALARLELAMESDRLARRSLLAECLRLHALAEQLAHFHAAVLP